jgi:hypothetical protein
LQGSALIYSKKVEYLLQLVNRTLHVLSTDKTKVIGKAAGKQAAKDAVAEDEAEFMMENFLTLDNVIKEVRAMRPFSFYPPFPHQRNIVRAFRKCQFNHPSPFPLFIIMQPPVSSILPFLPNPIVRIYPKQGKDIDIDQPAYNTRNAERRASLRHTTNHPMMAALLKEDRGSSFRMNSCRVHASGALVIGSSAGITSALDQLVSPAMAMAMSSMSASQRFQVRSGNGAAGMDFDDDLADDASLGGHDDYAGAAGYDDEPSLEVSFAPPAAAASASLFGVEKHSSSALESSMSSTSSAAADPWAMLDPHDPSSEVNKPTKVGKCFQVPETLAAAGKKTTKAAKGAAAAAAAAAAAKPLAAGGCRQMLQLQGLSYPEFGYVVRREKSRLSAVRKRERALLSGSNAAAEAGGYGSDNDGHYGGGGVDFGVYGEADDNDDDAGYFDDFDAAPADAEGGGLHGGAAGGFGEEQSLEIRTLDDAFQRAPRSYADMCREHIESFMRGVNQYTNESQLSQRVGEWQTRLAPVLEEQAQRRTFDIREYGHEIMGEVGEQMDSAKASNRAATKSSRRKSALLDENVIPLAAVTAGKPAYDVCRIFLASLQLANEGNLLLHHPENSGDVCGLNDLRVEVLSDVMSEERFDTYLAPSVAST